MNPEMSLLDSDDELKCRSIKLLTPIQRSVENIDFNISLNNGGTKNILKKHFLRNKLLRNTILNDEISKRRILQNKYATQVTKKSTEIISVNRPDGIILSPNKDSSVRVSQLEQNIRFLQEQHQTMLSGLHHEIEVLRQRNRDLQFQLVFGKGVVLSTPSSPEDDSKPRILLSPKQVNSTPLQIELLEKELGELKVNLQETNSKNSHLSTVVDEQKKKIESFENDWHQVKSNPPQQDPELRQRIEDADRLIRRLRRENDDQRRELATLRSSFANNDVYSSQMRENFIPQQHNRGNGGNGSGRRGTHHRGQREHRFPPLQTQSYWHQGSNNGRGNRGQGRSENETLEGAMTLPRLRKDNLPHSSSDFSMSFPNNSGGGNGNKKSGGYHQMHQGNSNHQYRGERNGDGERKYRGGQNRGSKS